MQSTFLFALFGEVKDGKRGRNLVNLKLTNLGSDDEDEDNKYEGEE